MMRRMLAHAEQEKRIGRLPASRQGNRRYRYYVTRSDRVVADTDAAWRIDAHDLERIVADRIAAFLADGIAIGRFAAATEPAKMKSAIARAASHATAGTALHDLADHVQIGDAVVTITIGPQPLLAKLGFTSDAPSDPITLTAAVSVFEKGISCG